MSGKWKRIDPTDIEVGDRVRQVDVTSEYRQVVSGVATYVTSADIELGGASLSPSIGTWYVRKPKHPGLKAPVWAEPMPEADEYDGHGAHYWRNRYTKQLAHSEQLQVANKNRRQKMQLLEKEAKDARGDSDYWRGEYAKVAAALHELRALTDPPEPLTRPDKPPVGSLFRVERSGVNYCRATVAAYVPVQGEFRWRWDQITEPGDTITRLELTEVDDKRDELFEANEKIAELERHLMDLSGGEW